MTGKRLVVPVVAQKARDKRNVLLVRPRTGGVLQLATEVPLPGPCRAKALAFCQHYGLPTALIDFTAKLRVAGQFASEGTPSPGAWGRIAVLDASIAKSSSQLWDVQDLCATRAARQRAYGLYVAGFPDLCNTVVRDRLGLQWFGFRRDPADEAAWQRGFRRLLAVHNDRLAGYLRHVIAMYARRVQPLTTLAADYLVDRIPIVPLLARLGPMRGYGAFEVPSAITFDAQRERSRTHHDWTKQREPTEERPTPVYRRLPGTRLARFTGT